MSRWITAVGAAAGDAVRGVGDTAEALYHFPADVVRYVLGVDRQMGEGRALGIGAVATGIWRRYDWLDANPISLNNPICGPVVRAVDVAAGMFYGAIDLVTGHLPYLLFNERLGWNLPYLAPPVASLREAARDLSMGAVLAAMPAVRGRARTPLPIAGREATASAKGWLRELHRDETGGIVLGRPEQFLGRRRVCNLFERARRGDLDAREELHRLAWQKPAFFPRSMMPAVVEWATTPDGSPLLGALVLTRPDLFSDGVVLRMVRAAGQQDGAPSGRQTGPARRSGIIRSPEHHGVRGVLAMLIETRPEWISVRVMPDLVEIAGAHARLAVAVRIFVDKCPDHFSRNVMPALLRAAGSQHEIAWAVAKLAASRPKRFAARDIPALAEVAKTHGTAAWALRALVLRRPDLAQRALAAIREAAAANPSVGWCLPTLVESP